LLVNGGQNGGQERRFPQKTQENEKILRFARTSILSQKLSLGMTFWGRNGVINLVSSLEALKNPKICTQNCKQGKNRNF
jgi:hypothetical protein